MLHATAWKAITPAVLTWLCGTAQYLYLLLLTDQMYCSLHSECRLRDLICDNYEIFLVIHGCVGAAPQTTIFVFLKSIAQTWDETIDGVACCQLNGVARFVKKDVLVKPPANITPSRAHNQHTVTSAQSVHRHERTISTLSRVHNGSNGIPWPIKWYVFWCNSDMYSTKTSIEIEWIGKGQSLLVNYFDLPHFSTQFFRLKIIHVVKNLLFPIRS